MDQIQKSLKHQIYSEAVAGKVNMKRMNKKIFWFHPFIPQLEEHYAIPLQLIKTIQYNPDSSMANQIVEDYLLSFPDPWETIIGFNLFYNSRPREMIETQR